MKVDSLKALFKSAVKEAFREELKDIIIEVLKSNNGSMINENHQKPQKVQITNNNLIETNETSNDPYNAEEIRNNYKRMLEETMNPQTENVFRPARSMDIINGELPAGDVSTEQIMNLLNPK